MPPKTLAIIAAAIIGVGALVGFIPVSASGVNCGSAFVASRDARVSDLSRAMTADRLGARLESLSPAEEACGSKRSVVRVPALLLLVGGLVTLVAAGMISANRPHPGKTYN